MRRGAARMVPWDMKTHYDLYRTWELHEWVLEGTVEYLAAAVGGVLCEPARVCRGQRRRRR